MDVKKTANLKKILFAMRFKLLLLGLFFMLPFVSLYFVEKLLIEKTHLFGSQMAQSYSIEQEKNFRAYTVALQFAGEELTQVITRRTTSAASTNVYDILKILQSLFKNSKFFLMRLLTAKLF